jgi:hypothetical protein
MCGPVPSRKICAPVRWQTAIIRGIGGRFIAQASSVGKAKQSEADPHCADRLSAGRRLPAIRHRRQTPIRVDTTGSAAPRQYPSADGLCRSRPRSIRNRSQSRKESQSCKMTLTGSILRRTITCSGPPQKPPGDNQSGCATREAGRRCASQNRHKTKPLRAGCRAEIGRLRARDSLTVGGRPDQMNARGRAPTDGRLFLPTPCTPL